MGSQHGDEVSGRTAYSRTDCLQATEERHRNACGSSRQLLAARAGRTKEEQRSQAAQFIGKCLLCLLAVAPPLSGQESARQLQTLTVPLWHFKGIRGPILTFRTGPQFSTEGQIRPRALQRKAPSTPMALQIMGNRRNAFCISCPISTQCQQVLNSPLNLRRGSAERHPG
jgi:hypothetical protein